MKEFYSPNELAKQKWFPIKSPITIYKLIASGEISAMNVSSTGKEKYMIPKKAVGHYLTMKFKGKLASKMAISKDEIIKFLAEYDDKLDN